LIAVTITVLITLQDVLSITVPITILITKLDVLGITVSITITVAGQIKTVAITITILVTELDVLSIAVPISILVTQLDIILVTITITIHIAALVHGITVAIAILVTELDVLGIAVSITILVTGQVKLITVPIPILITAGCLCKLPGLPAAGFLPRELDPRQVSVLVEGKLSLGIGLLLFTDVAHIFLPNLESKLVLLGIVFLIKLGLPKRECLLWVALGNPDNFLGLQSIAKVPRQTHQASYE